MYVVNFECNIEKGLIININNIADARWRGEGLAEESVGSR